MSGIGVADAHDFRRGVLRRLDVVERAEDLDAGRLRRFFLHALHAALQVRRVLIAGEDGDLALAVHELRELRHHELARLDVIDAVEREPLGLRRVAVERHDRARRDRRRR